MNILKTAVKRGWSLLLIAGLAIASSIYGWPVAVVAPVLGFILVVGLIMAVIAAREKELERVSLRLRQLIGYFNRRFMGDSSLSIFALINSLFNVENPKLWDWARACDMAQRIFNTWCDSLVSRVESDTRARRFDIHPRIYLNELWLATNHYSEFAEQFYEVAGNIEIPQETIDQYNRFVMEYNAFAQNFRDIISELRKVIRTEIEPASVKFTRELSVVK